MNQNNKIDSNQETKTIFEELLDFYTLLSPVLLMYFRTSDIYLVITMIPAIINIIGKFYKRYYSNNNNNILYGSYLNFYSTSPGGCRNEDFIKINWWLNENKKLLNINKLEIYNYFSDLHYNRIVEWRNYFTLASNKDIYFTYKNIQYKIICSEVGDRKDNRYVLSLCSEKIENCEKLINIAVSEHDSYMIELEKKIKQNKKPLFCSYKDKGFNKKEITINKTKKNVYLEDDITIFKDIKKFFEPNTEDEYNEEGKAYKIQFLLSGKTGSGKSSIVYAIANYFKLDIYNINIDQFYNADNLKEILDLIPKKSILLLEEIDSSKSTLERTKKSSQVNISPDAPNAPEAPDYSVKTGSCGLSLGELLPIFDGYNHLYGCIVIMTTNYPELLDSAFIRPGRIDKHFKFTYCSINLINKIIMKKTNGSSFSKKELDEIKNVKITMAELMNDIIIPNKYLLKSKLDNNQDLNKMTGSFDDDDDDEKTSSDSDNDNEERINKFKKIIISKLKNYSNSI